MGGAGSNGVYSGMENGNGRSYGNYQYASHSHSLPTRHFKVYLPIPSSVYSRLPNRPRPMRLLLSVLLISGIIIILTGFKKKGGKTTWEPPFTDDHDDKTVWFTKEEVARIWEWELRSGHHPSTKEGDSPELFVA